ENYLGRYEQALADADNALAINKDNQLNENLAAHFARACALNRLHRSKEALRDLQESEGLLSNATSYGQAERELWSQYLDREKCKAYMHLNMIEKARKIVDHNLELNAKQVWALRARAQIHMKGKALDQALRDIDEALALEPYNNALLADRAQFMLAEHEPAKALEQLSKIPAKWRDARWKELDAIARQMLAREKQ
ncbi:MAG TPA: hypothetical protein VFA15_09565, partial [Nitrososphaera sp.]|nr:hypothetical protein [Nitrososphaera sp.]